MKNHTTFLVLAVIGVLALSACEGGNLPVDQSATPTYQGGQQQEVLQPTTPTTPVPSEADMAAYSGAVQLKDITFCDKVKDEKLKNTCKTEVADVIALEEARTKADSSLCAKLSSSDKQEACKIDIEVSKAQEQTRINQENETEKFTQLANDIMQSGDVSRCKEVGGESVAKCEYTMLINQAYSANDPKLCDKASDSATIEKCKNAYQANLVSTDESGT